MNIEVTKEGGATRAILDGRLDTPASQEVAPIFESLNEAADGTVSALIAETVGEATHIDTVYVKENVIVISGGDNALI